MQWQTSGVNMQKIAKDVLEAYAIIMVVTLLHCLFKYEGLEAFAKSLFWPITFWKLV